MTKDSIARLPWLPLTLFATLLIYAFAAPAQLDLESDSPRYVMLARSLVDRQGYVGRFDLADQTETQYPFAYPLLLMPFVAAFGPRAYLSFEMLSVVCMVLSIWTIWFALRKWLPDEEARSIVLAVSFLGQMQMYSTAILSEAAYMAASFLCLGAMERIIGKSPSKRDYSLFAASLAVAFQLRTIGIALAASATLCLLLRGRVRRAILVGGIAFGACLPWLLWTFTKGIGYAPEFEDATTSFTRFVYRFLYNAAADITKALPDLFFYPVFAKFSPYEPMFFLKASVGLILLVLIGFGLWQSWRGSIRDILQRVSAAEVYLFAYGFICLSWTTHGARYLLPILPILMWALLRGCGRFRRQAVALFATIGLFGCLITIYRTRAGDVPPAETGFRQAVEWLKQNSSIDERVLSRFPTWVAAETGQRGVRYDGSLNSSEERDMLLADGISWLILDRNKLLNLSADDYLAPLIQRYPAEFELRFQAPSDRQTRVYRFTPR